MWKLAVSTSSETVWGQFRGDQLAMTFREKAQIWKKKKKKEEEKKHACLTVLLDSVVHVRVWYLDRSTSNSVTRRPSPNRRVHRWRIVGRPPDTEG